MRKVSTALLFCLIGVGCTKPKTYGPHIIVARDLMGGIAEKGTNVFVSKEGCEIFRTDPVVSAGCGTGACARHVQEQTEEERSMIFLTRYEYKRHLTVCMPVNINISIPLPTNWVKRKR